MWRLFWLVVFIFTQFEQMHENKKIIRPESTRCVSDTGNVFHWWYGLCLENSELKDLRYFFISKILSLQQCSWLNRRIKGSICLQRLWQVFHLNVCKAIFGICSSCSFHFSTCICGLFYCIYMWLFWLHLHWYLYL